MFTCGRNMTANKHNYWNYSSIKKFLFAIVLLTSSVEINADNVNLTESGSGQETNCTIYRTCTQCADASNCSWAFERQTCVYSNQSLSEDYRVVTKESCPEYAVTVKTEDKHYWIQVTVSNAAVKSVKTFFSDNATIGCEIENAVYNASINNGIITCEWAKENAISPEKRTPIDVDRLSVFYFSIVVGNGVRLRFNDPRDHYVSYRSGACADANCSIVFWESDPRKYYCKWCWKKNGCRSTAEPQYGCDVRRASNNEKLRDDDGDAAALSAIEVNSPDLAIESFRPDVLLVTRNTSTAVSVTVSDHRMFTDGRSAAVTVTVAGQSCENATAVDGRTISCTVGKYNDQTLDAEGPVRVEYAWTGKAGARKARLTSSQKFKFVVPTVTGVHPTCAPAAGGARIQLTGQHLNATADVRVFFKRAAADVACEIFELTRDRIGCVVTAADGKARKPGPLLVVFDNMTGVYTKQSFSYAAEPAVLDGQTFAGIASGHVPFVVRGRFDCTTNQQAYVDHNGERHYGRCAVRDVDGTAAMYCWPPKLDGPAAPTGLPLGFRAEMAGRPASVRRPAHCCRYVLHPDPVYADFEVRHADDAIRVNGQFPGPLQRRQPDGSYLLEIVPIAGDGDGDDGDRNVLCTVTDVTDDYAECRSPSGASLIDVLEIAVVLAGKQATRTVVHRRHRQYYYAMVRWLRPQYVVGGISCSLMCVFALTFCVKQLKNRSRRHVDRRYMSELRNITAGIDGTDYLLDSDTGNGAKT